MNKPILNNPAVFGGRKVIDVDTHLVEPHDLWTKRAPAKFKDRVPQVKVIDGVRSWVIDGDKILLKGAIPASTVTKENTKWPGLEFINHQFEEVHPASHSTRERVLMMDDMGISAQILYPNILGFGGQNAVKVDEELRLISVQLFNDAMAEIQRDSGERIFPMALIPWWDVDLSVAEIERAHRMGLKGININSDPHYLIRADGSRLPDLGQDHWAPMWEACVAYDMPVNFHIGASEQSMDFVGAQGWPGLHYDMRAALGGAMLFINNGRVMGNLILSGLLDRFPKLKFVSVESGIGWIPFLLEAIDYEYKETGANVAKLQRLPSEYFTTNFHACFWFERRDLTRQIRSVGVDNVLFETDFPHPVCLYPVDDMDKAMAGLTEEEKVKVLSGNAAKLYNIAV
ncbi:amidohydrolase family protein [Phenylobacterium sp. LjRoot219]|uniref:amidohydrolase family protein n=1 Tax=Phenylobacterium sp. LjRoot219 TaxID=3342283 RepID=UPI003ECEBFA9